MPTDCLRSLARVDYIVEDEQPTAILSRHFEKVRVNRKQYPHLLPGKLGVVIKFAAESFDETDIELPCDIARPNETAAGDAEHSPILHAQFFGMFVELPRKSPAIKVVFCISPLPHTYFPAVPLDFDWKIFPNGFRDENIRCRHFFPQFRDPRGTAALAVLCTVVWLTNITEYRSCIYFAE